MSEKNVRMRIDQAVVLIGQRGEHDSHPKSGSGRRILGLSLLERVVLTAFHSGVKDFLLVGDASVGGEIVSSFRKDKRLRDKDISLEHVSVSGLAAAGFRERIKGRFWLMEGDIVFSPAILERAARTEVVAGKDLLVVREIPQSEIGGTEAIPVQRGDDGRRVSGFNAGSDRRSFAYAGLGLCRRETYERLAEIFLKRGYSNLDSELMTGVFPPPRAEAIEAGSDFIERIFSRAALKRADRYLIGTARKPTDGFFAKNFNRHISLFLTRQLLKIGATPMSISIVVLFVGLASGWIVGRGGYLNAVLGALLFELASIIDGCDGENARLTFRGTKFGGTFDITADAVTFVFFFINLPLGLYRSTGNDLWLSLGGFAFLSMFLFYVQLIRYARKSGIGNNIVAVVKDIERSAGGTGIRGKIDWAASKIAPLFRRDFFATMAVLFILPGWTDVFMGMLIFLSPLETLYIFFYTRRRLRPADQES